MPRVRLVWMLTLPLAVVGSQTAHALAYRIVETNHADRVEALAATGHGYLTYLPLCLAVCTVLVGLALLAEARLLLRGGRDATRRPAALPFAVLAPSIFLLQEHFERLAHDGSVPWGTAVEATFLAGLALQLPIAVLAYGVARLLLRAVVSLVHLLGRTPRRRHHVALATRPSRQPFRLRIPALARGYGPRAPPALAV